MQQNINISTSTFFRFFLIILGLIFLYAIRDILLIIFIAFIVAAAIDAPVDWLARYRIRRGLGAATIYLSIFALLALFIYLIFPSLSSQITLLADNLPEYFAKFGAGFSAIKQKIGAPALQQILSRMNSQLTGSTSDVWSAAVNIFGGVSSAIIILVISVYLVVQDKGLKMFLASVMPARHSVYAVDLAERIQAKLGAWLRGQLILMLIIGAMSFIGLTLLGVKFALTLALIAGVFEVIPYIGPFLGAVPAVALAFLQSPFLALIVAALYLVIQKFEGYLIIPLVMKKRVGLNPLIILISLIVGGKLGGIWGVVVAVPIVAAVSVFLKDIFTGEAREDSK